MSVIAGVGDEVVGVVCVLLAAVVALLAWWSTAARPDRFRTVIVMERTARFAPHQLTLLGLNIRRHLLRGSTPPAAPPVETEPAGSVPETATIAESGSDSEEPPAGSAQAREMDRIVDAMDADINVLRHRRLNFFTRTSGESTRESSPQTMTETSVETSAAPPSTKFDPAPTQILSQDSQADGEGTEDKHATNQIDNNETGNNETSCKHNEAELNRQSAGDSIVEPDDVHKVNIKLKYLNDTFREVDGKLEELLKDFKWRHFSRELSGNCRVLLIYNGHVLSEEGSTLRACGLHHNCVVHCLVHPPRSQRGAGGVGGTEPPSLLEAAGARRDAAAPAEGAPPAEPRSWDLENVLMTLVSIVLTVIWFFRCEYSNMFTASASGALFALTVFYSIAIFGLYFSDTFQLAERRPAAPPAPAPPPPADQPA